MIDSFHVERVGDEYRLIIYDRDEEYGGRTVHDIIQGDYRYVMGRALAVLDPESSPEHQLVPRKRGKTAKERREALKKHDERVTARAREIMKEYPSG